MAAMIPRSCVFTETCSLLSQCERLYRSAQDGNIKEVALCIEEGATVNWRNPSYAVSNHNECSYYFIMLVHKLAACSCCVCVEDEPAVFTAVDTIYFSDKRLSRMSHI